ncbi:Clp protease N-terminal domain-containing protein [Streptomyces sp. NPDC002755]|uniref:Clp protease N-terminal domain-containing protein n=1 Tax=Streptomyces sp. NPDC002884 TaxID=3154544 RepID=UPI00331D0A85
MHKQPKPAADESTTEFAPDVTELLTQSVRRALVFEDHTAGTEHLLFALVRGDTDAGAALAPGTTDAGGLSGLIVSRTDGGWAQPDDGDHASADANAEDQDEILATWREAQWQTARRYPRAQPQGEHRLPVPSGALSGCLTRALRLARQEEGTSSVRCRHVARSLLSMTDSRAVEALLIRGVDLGRAAAALRASAKAERTRTGPESAMVTLLRQAGQLGEPANWWTRKVSAWVSKSSGDGTPVLLAICGEAKRQAVRCGRDVVEPVDLLLAVPGLDRSLTVAGLSFPAEPAANSGAQLLYACGVRPTALAAATRTEVTVAAPVPRDVPFTAAAERTVARARLAASKTGSGEVGTVHLLSALLEDPEGPITRLLREQGTDLAVLHTRLSGAAGISL